MLISVDLKNTAMDLKGSVHKWAENEKGIEQLKLQAHSVKDELYTIKQQLEESYERQEQKRKEAQARAVEYNEAWWDAAEKGLPLPAKPVEQDEESFIGSHLSQLRENISIVGDTLKQDISEKLRDKTN